MKNYPQNITVRPFDSSCLNKAKKLAAELKLEMTTQDEGGYSLVVKPTYLEIQQNNKKSVGPLRVNFLEGPLTYRLQQRQSKELLQKAIGIKGNSKPFVIDATAGLGKDSFILASLGCRVLMLERIPCVAALLADGLERALAESHYKNLQLQLLRVEAKKYLQDLAISDYPDVVYLDPMFPDRRKSALVKKDMRYLQELIGEDSDGSDLLKIALQRAKHRVVVKRPLTAPLLIKEEPHHSIRGKNIRFDVYMKGE